MVNELTGHSLWSDGDFWRRASDMAVTAWESDNLPRSATVDLQRGRVLSKEELAARNGFFMEWLVPSIQLMVVCGVEEAPGREILLGLCDSYSLAAADRATLLRLFDSTTHALQQLQPRAHADSTAGGNSSAYSSPAPAAVASLPSPSQSTKSSASSMASRLLGGLLKRAPQP